MSYEDTKNAINDNIYANGNQEIKGNILNGVLLAMLNYCRDIIGDEDDLDNYPDIITAINTISQAISVLEAPNLQQVSDKGNVTSNRLFATQVFQNKTPEEFAQYADIASNVVFVDSFDDLPSTGESGKIYITEGKIYFWDGSDYEDLIDLSNYTQKDKEETIEKKWEFEKNIKIPKATEQDEAVNLEQLEVFKSKINLFSIDKMEDKAWYINDTAPTGPDVQIRINDKDTYHSFILEVEEGDIYSISRKNTDNQNRFRVGFFETKYQREEVFNFVSDDNALLIDDLVVPNGCNYMIVYLVRDLDDNEYDLEKAGIQIYQKKSSDELSSKYILASDSIFEENDFIDDKNWLIKTENDEYLLEQIHSSDTNIWRSAFVNVSPGKVYQVSRENRKYNNRFRVGFINEIKNNVEVKKVVFADDLLVIDSLKVPDDCSIMVVYLYNYNIAALDDIDISDIGLEVKEINQKGISEDSNNSISKDNYFYTGNYTHIAHRGIFADSDVPENSIDSIIRAKRMQFNAIEVDVATTSDGKHIIMHDKTINRTARNADDYSSIDGNVNVEDETLEHFQENYVLESDNKKYRKPIPSLREFLESCIANNIIPWIDTKGGDDKTIYDEVVEIMGDNFVAFSKDKDLCRYARSISDCLVLYNNSDTSIDIDEDVIPFLNEIGGWAGFSSMRDEVLTRENITKIKKLGYEVQSSIPGKSLEPEHIQRGATLLLVNHGINLDRSTSNIIDIYDDGNFELFDHNGEVEDGILTLQAGDRIRYTYPSVLKYAGMQIRIRFKGKFEARLYTHGHGVHEYEDYTEIVISRRMTNKNPYFTFTAQEETKISDINLKISDFEKLDSQSDLKIKEITLQGDDFTDYSNPITLIDGVENKIIAFDHAIVFIDDSEGDIYNNVISFVKIGGAQIYSELFNGDEGKILKLKEIGGTSNPMELEENEDLVIELEASTFPTAGSMPVRLKIFYRLIDKF